MENTVRFLSILSTCLACRSVDLEALIDGPFLFGKVDQPQITIYTYLLHDMEAKPTSLEIYQNGKPHEKFLNGEWWKYDTTRAAATANGIAIVGLLDNGCLTEPKIFNLPLQVRIFPVAAGPIP